MKFQENDFGSGQQSEYIRCYYTPFASLYVATADSTQKEDFSFFFPLLFSGKASWQVFTASYSKVLKIQVK